MLRAAAATGSVDLDVIDDDGRPALADASRRTEQMRAHDSSYQAELLWWTGYSEPEEGIPPSALASDAEATRVDVARSFPRSGDEDRRADVDRDHSRIVVLSTYDDSRDNALRAGEVLSTLLLECTAAGLATCTLTHMMEVNASRELVRRLVGRVAEPQVLIRVGRAPRAPRRRHARRGGHSPTCSRSAEPRRDPTMISVPRATMTGGRAQLSSAPMTGASALRARLLG